MKTGATEVSSKIPIHLNTTFACVPNYLVFSDVAETFQGLKIHDALEHLDTFIDKDLSPDEWRFYQSLQSLHDPDNRTALEHLGRHGADEAWKLDKFKNVPMVHKAHELYPDMKWYVFVDADTSIMFSSLLAWLSKLDHKNYLYMGSQNLIGDMEFGHGGSGYVMSSKAVKIIAYETPEMKTKHLEWAGLTCCGDLALSNALLDHNVHLLRSWPMIQGETPSTLDFDENHWRWPTVTWHHMSPKEIEEMWLYEQQILANHSRPPTFAVVFETFLWAKISDERKEWDNIAKDEVIHRRKDNNERERLAVESFEGCRETCLEMYDCVQFNFNDKQGKCGLGKSMRLGKKLKGYHSGWNLPRMERFREEHANTTTEWVTE
jgi:hypothetical protein